MTGTRKAQVVYKYSLFLEWIRTRPNSMAFLLNTICPSCKKNSPVLIQSPTGKMHCGKCWRVWVGYEEPISR